MLEGLGLLDSQEPRSVATLDVTGPPADGNTLAGYTARIVRQRDICVAILSRVCLDHVNARMELFVSGHVNKLPHGARMCKGLRR